MAAQRIRAAVRLFGPRFWGAFSGNEGGSEKGRQNTAPFF
jgi:hypothetical protein